MKRKLQTLALLLSIAASLSVGCSSALKITERTDPSRPSSLQVQEGYDTFGRKWEVLSRQDFVLLNYTGTITDIDYPNREITLQGPQGQIETFVVDKKVQRLNEAKVGDKVAIDYYIGFNAEVRNPTAEEERNPLVVLDAAGRAGPEAAPAAYDMRRVRAVATIVGIDHSAQTVTVKGPQGKTFVARVADPSRLKKVRVGEKILMTFTQAAAISLKPAGN